MFTAFFLRLFLPLLFILAAAAYFMGNQEISLEIRKLRDQEAVSVSLGAGVVSARLDTLRSDLVFLSEHSALRAAVNSPSAVTIGHLAEDFSTFSFSRTHYDQLRWIDENGMEKVRVDYSGGKPVIIPAEKLQNKAGRYFFSDTMKLAPGEIFVSPLDLNIEQNRVEIPYKPMLRIATPVADHNGNKRGIVILNYSAAELLQVYVSSTSGHAAMLLNSEGYWLKGLNPADEWGFMFKRPEHSMARRHPVVWAKIGGADLGQAELDDGLWTWRTIYPLLADQTKDAVQTESHRYFWKAVSHLSEARLSEVREKIWLKVAGIALLLAVLLGAGCGMLARLWGLLNIEKTKYRAVADFTYDWETWIDPEGRCIYCSPSFTRITGHAVDEFMQDPAFLISITHPDDRDRLERHMQLHGTSDEGSVFAIRILMPDGELRWLEHACHPVFDDAGKYLGRRASNRDITARKLAEAALQESERRYHFMFDNNPMAMWIYEKDSLKIREVNSRAIAQYGYTREEFCTMSLPDICVGEGVPDDETALEGSIYTHHRRKDGAMIDVLVSTMPYASQSARIALIQDVTLQKLVESEREGQLSNLHALINSIRETAFLMELDGTIRIINEIGARRLNVAPQELTGKNIFDVLPAELARSRRAIFEQVVQSKSPAMIEDERAGRCLQSSIYPVIDAGGQVSRFAVYSADVTQQRRQQGIDEILSAINQQVLQGVVLSEILSFICSRVAELFRLDVVWLGRKEAGGRVGIVAAAGAAEHYVVQMREKGVRWDDSPQGQGPTGCAIRLGRTEVFRGDDPGFETWAKLAMEHHLSAIMAIPLEIRGEVYGAFTLYSADAQFFDSSSLRDTLSGISKSVCVLIEAAIDQQRVRLLSSALEVAGNGVMITDHQGTIQWVNPAFSGLCGYSEQELLGQTPRILKSGQQSGEYYQALWATITRGELWSSETVERAKDGSLYTVSQTITPLFTEGDISHFIAIHDDISAQKLSRERIEHLAHYDALTGLPNRTLFFDRLRQALSVARRQDSGLALMYMDLDGFKLVNDSMGHHAGDLLLAGVAERLMKCTRASDTVARLGGDEFTVILSDTHREEAVAEVAQKIVDAISRPFDLEGRVARIGISIGIARYTEEADSEDELIRRADQSMYRAKSAGKNTYCFAVRDGGGS